jgi:DNA-binding transcriptional LysR family regulator
MTQSAVSQQIKSLEAAVGRPLLGTLGLVELEHNARNL